MGISYLRYANICAQVVRRSLKEPLKTKAMSRDNTTMKVATVDKGVKTSVRESPSWAVASHSRFLRLLCVPRPHESEGKATWRCSPAGYVVACVVCDVGPVDGRLHAETRSSLPPPGLSGDST